MTLKILRVMKPL